MTHQHTTSISDAEFADFLAADPALKLLAGRSPRHRQAARAGIDAMRAAHAKVLRGSQPSDAPAEQPASPREREARAAAQKAYDEVMAGSGSAFSSTHSRNAGAAVAAHAVARKRLLDDAIAADKIPESRRPHYAALYDKDPAGTTRTIAALTACPGLNAAKPKPTTGAAGARMTAQTDSGTIEIPATGPLPTGLSLLHGQRWRDEAAKTRERDDLEQYAIPAGESLLRGRERLDAAARRRENARLMG